MTNSLLIQSHCTNLSFMRNKIRNVSFIILVCVLLSSFAITAAAQTEKATFAGGCYWCMEEVFDKLDGVASATSGFSADHLEAVEVVYDPGKISYEKLLDIYWKNIDPTDDGGQFCDRGPQYRSGIYVYTEEQKAVAEKSKSQIEQTLKRPVVTSILPAGSFSNAKDQDYWKTNPSEYKAYKMRCGRSHRLRDLWGSK